jgi:preprotein translocase subunit SecD
MRVSTVLFGWVLLLTGCAGSDHEPMSRGLSPEVFGVRLVLDPESDQPGRSMRIEGQDKEHRVSESRVVDGRHLRGVDVVRDLEGTFSLSIRLNEEGTSLLAEFTRRHVDQRLAVLVGGRLVVAPILKEEIRDGHFLITGRFSEEQATNMARTLLGG